MEASSRWAIASQRVVLPDGVRPAVVHIDGSRIVGITTKSDAPHDYPLQDVGELVVAPGLVDTHVHINEPGRTKWEGFETATRAAAAGGVTTLVDMPLNSSPVTIDVEALHRKRAAAHGKTWVDVGFYGGLVAGSAGNVPALLDAGVLGMKAFLCDSGLDEFPAATADDLHAAAPALELARRPLLVHGELLASPAPRPASSRIYAEYLASRPAKWEADAIDLVIDVCRAHHCPLHLVHLADADSLPKLAAAKREGMPLTVETCPHYLHFAAEEVGDGQTQYKCAPPIREARHRDGLWRGLQDGVIDTIGSDHSPCPPEMKHLESGDFLQAWGGIASLQLTLPIVWTGARARKVPLAKIFHWLSSAPASLVGLANRKGRLAAGYDADIIVFDSEESWLVRGTELYHRHPVTPYDGQTLFGLVQQTYLRGNKVFDRGVFSSVPLGNLLDANYSA